MGVPEPLRHDTTRSTKAHALITTGTHLWQYYAGPLKYTHARPSVPPKEVTAPQVQLPVPLPTATAVLVAASVVAGMGVMQP